MNQLPSNIRKELLKLVPLSIANEIACFAFYDNHPRDPKAIDVIVCTQRGELREYYKREVCISYMIQNVKNISELKLLRNGKCDLFYLVLADDNIILLSRKEDDISIVHKIGNICSYSFEDIDCNGQARLKVIKNDDAVPLIFDDNFVTLQEMHIMKEPNKSDTLPLLVQLKRKLSEAQYCVKFNESKYKKLLELRQEAIYDIYQTRKSDELPTSAAIDLKEITNILQVESKHPEIKLCHKKLLIILNIMNKNPVPLEDVTALLHTPLKHSITYKTRMYKEVAHSPYWQEKDDRIIEANTMVYVIAVINLKEMQHCANSKIKFEVVLSYQKDGKSLLLPFDEVFISACDIMGEQFDILSCKTDDEKKALLCVLSTCEKNILHLKHIATIPSDSVTPHEIFCTHLNMKLFGADNVVIHNTSPYHKLHGVVAIFKHTYDYNIDIEVYTRSPSQILALIHYIYDAVPHRIIALTPNIKMTSLDAMEEEITEEAQNLNLQELGKSLIDQTTLLKEYFDECLIKMNESKNPMVQAKVGREIDVAAQGRQKFLEFRQKWLDIAEKGIKGLKKSENYESFEMIVD